MVVHASTKNSQCRYLDNLLVNAGALLLTLLDRFVEKCVYSPEKKSISRHKLSLDLY